MFGRPRCREWTPLATQQLRLRSLIQIVGFNIRPPERCRHLCSFYYTLHHTTMSAPFYTSERISSPHPKWKEIDSEITSRMSSTNVVVRIWCHILQGIPTTETVEKQPDSTLQTWGVYFSGLKFIGPNVTTNFSSDSFKSNTLVFQMHGGYFCSYKNLKLEVIPTENELEQNSLSSESSGKTSASCKAVMDLKSKNHRTKESRSISPNKFTKKTDKEYSKSHSPVERGFKQNFPHMKTSASLNIAHSREFSRYRDNSSDRKSISDANQIFEHSPHNLDVKEFTTNDKNCDSLSKNASQENLFGSRIDLSETAENYDLRNESDNIPKYRYMALNFLKSEIRPSYNVTKLQKLHLLQYSIKKRQDAVQEIKERIYQKSALSNYDDAELKQKVRSRPRRNLFSTEDEASCKSSSNSDLSTKNGRIKTEDRPLVSNGPRLALKLNDLLSFKSKPSPLQRAEHVRLTKQLEILRFKKIILSDERDAKLANIRRLKERHAKLAEENQDVGSELMLGFHALSKRNEALKGMRQSAGACRELAARTHVALAARRTELMGDLHNIFHIRQKDDSTWTICDIPLPICGDENPRRTNHLSESVAAGLTAQLTTLLAALLDQPLRYPITLLGSETKILDIMPDLPDPNIPLYARGGDVTLFRYAMFLLNKCIVQLMVGRGVHVTDMRPTLANLNRLMTSQGNSSDTSKLFGPYKWLAEIQCPRTQSLRSLVASERGKYRQFNRFKDAVDGQSPQTVMSLRRHRHTRSVGSYQDDTELSMLDASTTSIMGSEPSLYDSKLKSNVDLETKVLKPHNSDSEISKMSTSRCECDNNVVFTLGDDNIRNVDGTKLVRITSNNGDDVYFLDENVKRICTEISDFCSASDHCARISSDKDTDMFNKHEIHEAFDVAKHMEAINENLDFVYDKNGGGEFMVSCDNKQKCTDITCANTVVNNILMPCSEVNFDKGQSETEDSSILNVTDDT